MSRRPASGLSGFGTTLFTEYSALAERPGAINRGQGFPDGVDRTVTEVVLSTLVQR